MKKIILVVIMLLMCFGLFAQSISVDQYSGYQWEAIGPIEKQGIVGGFLAGFSMWRDYIFDLETNVYDYYQSFDKFLEREDVIENIIDDLDRYYIINKNGIKYDDRVSTMIIIFYGKYWWIEIPID